MRRPWRRSHGEERIPILKSFCELPQKPKTSLRQRRGSLVRIDEPVANAGAHLQRELPILLVFESATPPTLGGVLATALSLGFRLSLR